MSLPDVFKALSDPVRRDILLLLKQRRKMSAGEIVAEFELSNATISYHLSILKKADLVFETRYQKYIYYEINTSVFEDAMMWLMQFRGVTMKMNRNARITLIMTTAVCLAILATAAIINTIHGNENQALVIQCIIFAVYNIALNFALNNIRIVKQNAARKLVLIGKWSMPSQVSCAFSCKLTLFFLFRLTRRLLPAFCRDHFDYCRQLLSQKSY